MSCADQVQCSAHSPADMIGASGGIAPLPHSRGEMFKRIDELESAMLSAGPLVQCPLKHTFTCGLYSRQITMPAGTLVTSKIHKTQHQFVVSCGVVSVLVAGGEWQTFTAPYSGVTEPGTRRVLYIHEDTVWTTFHPTSLTSVEEIEADIIEPHDDYLAGLTDEQIASIRAVQNGGLPCLG